MDVASAEGGAGSGSNGEGEVAELAITTIGVDGSGIGVQL
jgi:hypothetical protein